MVGQNQDLLTEAGVCSVIFYERRGLYEALDRKGYATVLSESRRRCCRLVASEARDDRGKGEREEPR